MLIEFLIEMRNFGWRSHQLSFLIISILIISLHVIKVAKRLAAVVCLFHSTPLSLLGKLYPLEIWYYLGLRICGHAHDPLAKLASFMHV